jgi:hypothetical protein
MSFVGAHQDEVEEIETRWVPFERAVEMVLAGEITEVCSVALILRYQLENSVKS